MQPDASCSNPSVAAHCVVRLFFSPECVLVHLLVCFSCCLWECSLPYVFVHLLFLLMLLLVNLSTHLCAYPMYLFYFCVWTCPAASLPIYREIYLCSCPRVCVFVRFLVPVSNCLCVSPLAAGEIVYLHVCLSTCLCTCPPVCALACVSVQLFLYLSTSQKKLMFIIQHKNTVSAFKVKQECLTRNIKT